MLVTKAVHIQCACEIIPVHPHFIYQLHLRNLIFDCIFLLSVVFFFQSFQNVLREKLEEIVTSRVNLDITGACAGVNAHVQRMYVTPPTDVRVKNTLHLHLVPI